MDKVNIKLTMYYFFNEGNNCKYGQNALIKL